MKRIMMLTLATLGVLALSGCGTQGGVPGGYSSTNYNTPPSAEAPSAPTQAATTPTPAADNTIAIQDFSFNPATLTVKKGTTVTWINNDSAMHTVKSDAFTSGSLAKGDTFQFTFDTAGTFNYSCGIHPSMMGTIIVQ